MLFRKKPASLYDQTIKAARAELARDHDARFIDRDGPTLTGVRKPSVDVADVVDVATFREAVACKMLSDALGAMVQTYEVGPQTVDRIAALLADRLDVRALNDLSNKLGRHAHQLERELS